MKLLELPVRTLAYIGGPDRVRELEEHFPECKFFMFAGKTGADVVENEASKAEGLKRLCEYYGMDLSHNRQPPSAPPRNYPWQSRFYFL